MLQIYYIVSIVSLNSFHNIANLDVILFLELAAGCVCSVYENLRTIDGRATDIISDGVCSHFTGLENGRDSGIYPIHVAAG